MTIRAIETRYKGYRFRSRLEARYAIFLDNLKVAWDYEVQGFALPSGPYLPDFWLPGFKCWLEIKGEEPSEQERALAHELANATGCRVYIFYGPVPGTTTFQSGEVFDGESWDNFRAFCVCDTCGLVGIQYEGRSDRLPCKKCHECDYYEEHSHSDGADVHFAFCDRHGKGTCPTSDHGDRGHTHNHPIIQAAVEAARSARFEHGETP